MHTNGNSQVPSPNIDRLAEGGMRLNKYYVNPVCSPTRASLMVIPPPPPHSPTSSTLLVVACTLTRAASLQSGRSVVHHGIFTPYGGGDDASGLNLTFTLLPAHLKKDYGYATYMIGKCASSPWHRPRGAPPHRRRRRRARPPLPLCVHSRALWAVVSVPAAAVAAAIRAPGPEEYVLPAVTSGVRSILRILPGWRRPVTVLSLNCCTAPPTPPQQRVRGEGSSS